MTADYRLETRLRDGSYVATIPHRNLQFEMGINGPSGIRFDLPLHHEVVTVAAIWPGLHEIWVKRNGTVVAAGPLWDITPSSDGGSITCSAMSLEDYLDVRLCDDIVYTLTDQSNIAWGLIDRSQTDAITGTTGSTLGFTKGTVGLGRTRTMEFRKYDNKYILEAINDMSELEDGFDWWIDPVNRQFRTSYPRLQVDRKLTLAYRANVRGYAVQYMGKYMRNVIRVQGAEPATVTATNPASITKYGRREYGDSFKDAATATELTAYAGYVRDLRYEPKRYPTITVDIAEVNIFDPTILSMGDQVKVIIDDGYVQFNELLRYKGCQVTVGKGGKETAVVYMEDLRELN